ncbi:MAG: glycosyltransferase family 4 protein [Bacteroidota bacterium]
MRPLPPDIAIVGRFPPPLDGQAVATRTLSDVLEEIPGVRVHRVNLSAPEHDVRADESALRRLRHYLDARRHVREALADLPDAPVIWTTISPKPIGHLRDLAAVVFPLGSRRPVVAVVHHGDFQKLFENPVTRFSARRLVRRLSALSFNTPGLAERCAAWVPAPKRFVSPNTTAEDTHLSPVAFARDRTVRRPGDPIRLLYLSGMIPTKGYLDVLEAVGELHRRGTPVRATWAGRWTGPQPETEFWSRVDALGLRPVVKHMGSVNDRREVRRLYLHADVFLLPTTYPTEAHPLTIMEALNAGTPVVATPHASIPEMIEDGRSGLLAPPHNPSSLADAVEQLRPLDTWQAFSAAARDRYMSTFAPDVVRDRWLGLLERLPGPGAA